MHPPAAHPASPRCTCHTALSRTPLHTPLPPHSSVRPSSSAAVEAAGAPPPLAHGLTTPVGGGRRACGVHGWQAHALTVSPGLARTLNKPTAHGTEQRRPTLPLMPLMPLRSGRTRRRCGAYRWRYAQRDQETTQQRYRDHAPPVPLLPTLCHCFHRFKTISPWHCALPLLQAPYP
jgi:hypothetical protein